MKILSLPILLSTLTAALLNPSSRPECFPPSPACLRPQVLECRDALLKMRYTDPGFVTTFGRRLEWKRSSIDVPRIWHSFPKNCAVKLDAATDEVTDAFRLMTLTTQGEEVIEACIIHGSRCGGVVSVGPKRVMRLSVGYYSAVRLRFGGRRGGNGEDFGGHGALALNRTGDLVDELGTS